MHPKSWLLRALFGIVLAAGLVWGVIGLTRWRDARALTYARGEIEALLAAKDNPQARTRHAAECIRLSEPLVSRGGTTGTAAALFIKGAAPFASYGTGHVPLPPAGEVQKLSIQDLLPITRLLVEAERLAAADQLVDVLLQRPGSDRAEILTLAANLRLRLGRDMEVLAHCKELTTLRPNDPLPYRIEARVHRNHGRWELFVDAAREALKRSDPPDDELRVEIADALLHQGLTADARKEFDLIRRRRPDLAERAPTVEARLLTQEGNLKRAEQVLTEFLRESPEDDEALILLGSLLIGDERFKEAVVRLERAAALAPAEEQAHYLLSQAYARTGKPDLAKQSLARHRSILDTKVRLQSLENQAAREPRNVNVRQELAEGYEKIGLRELAEFWRRAQAAAEE